MRLGYCLDESRCVVVHVKIFFEVVGCVQEMRLLGGAVSRVGCGHEVSAICVLRIIIDTSNLSDLVSV